MALEQDSAKTGASAAGVDSGPATIDVLMRWKVRQNTEREMCGELWEGARHVFTLPDGSPLNPSYVTKLFTKIRKAAG